MVRRASRRGRGAGRGGGARGGALRGGGVGVLVYLVVRDVDRFHEQVRSLGVRPHTSPTTQFYGIRGFVLDDLDGYRFDFHGPAALSARQSCGMPLRDARPGQMYCGYCADEKGALRPYEAVLEGTTTGCFMGMKKMPRAEAEKAAREHLARMPAWKGRR